MIEIDHLTDSDLVADIKESVAKEKQATLAVIEKLRIIADRRVHLSLGYNSLHEFAVVELGYSDGSAYRRIQAMKLCDEVPSSKEAIANGSLHLCAAAALMDHLKREIKGSLTPEAKEELLEKVKGKSKRECERILNPEQDGQSVHFVADDETLEDLKRLSELLAVPEREMSVLIKKIARIARKKLDPVLRKSTPPVKLKTPEAAPAVRLMPRKSRPYTESWVKTTVWQRDESQCSFVSPINGRRCTSRFAAQGDHIIPVALGGASTVENMRVLCPAHNKYEAERIFGRQKMKQYTRRP